MGDSDDCPTTSFGPDGSITDPELLRLIRESKPLPPKDLLKLVTFFAKIPTYTLLTERLAVFALITILTKPRIAKDVQVLLGINTQNLQDQIEDSIVDIDHEIEDENTNFGAFARTVASGSRSEDATDGAFARIVAPGSRGIGLLIEAQDKKFFAVAVSPDPATLPDDPEAQGERVKSLGRHIARREARKAHNTSNQS
jgi:hypothetical protein